MERPTTLLFLFVCALPQLALANTSNSSKIGINVTIGEKPQCNFHITDEDKPKLYLASSLDCEIKAETLQKEFTRTKAIQKLADSISDSNHNTLSRVILVVQ